MSDQCEEVMTIKVEIGRRRMPEKEVRRLVVGEVVELDTDAGSPLAIYADGKLIGRGEAVVVGDRYGVRITEIIPPDEW